MTTNSTLQVKLKNLRNSLNMNQTDFANSLGVSQAAIANVESGKRDVSKSLLIKIKETYQVDLLSCTEEMNDNSLYSNVIPIPFYNVAASAGSGATLICDEPEKGYMYFDKRFLKQILKTESYDTLHLIHAVGDSMDSGWNQPDDIKDGDLLMVDTSQTTGNNHIFVILVNNTELRVKRLFKRGDVLYISSNNSKYKEEVYDPDRSNVEIQVVGKVVWNGSKENI